MNQKEFFIISIGIFATIIAWLIADIIHTSTTDKVKAKIDISKPIQYSIDPKIFEILKEKTP